MPIYEYEPEGRECLMCDGRVAAIQEIGEEPLRYCPYCGLEVRRVVSTATFRIPKGSDPENAGKKGFTTFRRSSEGIWEKLSGPGVDAIVASDEDRAAVQAEKRRPKSLDLDS